MRILTEKKTIYTGVLMALILLLPLHSQERGEKLASVYKISASRNQIVIASPRASLLFKMGDLVYVPTENKDVILTVTFPMQTVAKCKAAGSHAKYISEISKGMPVYRYEPGNTLASLKEDFERLDEIRMYNGRILRGAIISRGKMYLVLTPTGKVKIPEEQIKNIRIIR